MWFGRISPTLFLSLLLAPSAIVAFLPCCRPGSIGSRSISNIKNKLHVIAPGKKDVLDKLQRALRANQTPEVFNQEFHDYVQGVFPGAITNKALTSKIYETLQERGIAPQNTLLATSLCSDELAKKLADEFVLIYGNNFNLGDWQVFLLQETLGLKQWLDIYLTMGFVSWCMVRI